VFHGSCTPAPPTGLTGVDSCGGVILSWQLSLSATVTGYRLYRSTSSGIPKNLVASLGPSATLYLDAGVTAGRTYDYEVTAVAGVTESVPASGVNVLHERCASPPIPYTGPLRVYPNPFNPKTAVRGTVKFEGLPVGSQVRLYTPAGLKVWEGKVTVPNVVEWNGKTESGRPVSPGVYPWVAEGGGRKDRGTLIVE